MSTIGYGKRGASNLTWLRNKMVKTPAKKQSTLFSFFNKTPTRGVALSSIKAVETRKRIDNTKGKKRKVGDVVDITDDETSENSKRTTLHKVVRENDSDKNTALGSTDFELTDEERQWLFREALAANRNYCGVGECSSTHMNNTALNSAQSLPKYKVTQERLVTSKSVVALDIDRQPGMVKVEGGSGDLQLTTTSPAVTHSVPVKKENVISNLAEIAMPSKGGVLFLDMSQTFSELEKESGRIKNSFVLIRFIWRVLCESQDELIEAVYLLMGMLAPSYENIALGVGSASLAKIIVDTTGSNRNTFRALASEHGDMGEAAYRLAPKQRSQMFVVQKKALRMSTVHSQLLHLSKISGSKAQSKREGVLRKLFVGSSPVEMKYLVRLCELNLRVGAAPKTILTCLAYSLYMYLHLNIVTEEEYVKYDLNQLRKDPDVQIATQSLLSAYSRCPNPRVVLETALRLKDIKGLAENCPLTPGIPVKPMLGKPVTSIHALMEKLQDAMKSNKFSADQSNNQEKQDAAVKYIKPEEKAGQEHLTAQQPFVKVEHDLHINTESPSIFCCETKYDGQRVQVHRLSDGTYRFFSRNLLDNQAWPDLIPMLQQSAAQAQARTSGLLSDEVGTANLDAKAKANAGDESIVRVSADAGNTSVSFIIDAEVVAVRRNEKKPEQRAILPFQTLSTRGRNNVEVGRINVQVCLMIFDIMLYDDRALTSIPLLGRRRTLQRVFDVIPGCVEFTDSIETSSEAEVTAHYRKSIVIGEGLMCKRLTDVYETGERGDSWFKLKKDYIVEADAPAKAQPETGESCKDGEGAEKSLCGDSLDLVPIAAWRGMGRKAKWYSPYLLAAYDRETGYYHSVCKVMSGFTDEVYKRFHRDMTMEGLSSKPSDYIVSDTFRPAIWFPPTRVWEIRGADLTISPVHTAGQGMVAEDSNKGVSFRFPRFIRERAAEDKAPEDATSTAEVVEMFFAQGQKIDSGIRDDE
ncbi:hypothetical protein SARC_00271 [Sphaeroforma arctica JP610]|uniref:ATP-dependent DNA ligase family profile domain-containing protein n=1 Tax=Sphaeroforma arctica JP610 TaxID=667725 RepID=A0A0L0GFM8_9EUKA|nr:hypothetical protein SARC_00271 [Sphaeroforma arctica JP610]KNC87641.1 hypothetical protein SARC_00271 [Sphaeroforma arctica JP610]|eukprot:XP_014161543.1 hypothetical protein SARC_00271 [Sphaeroforma arctica JP610]